MTIKTGSVEGRPDAHIISHLDSLKISLADLWTRLRGIKGLILNLSNVMHKTSFSIFFLTRCHPRCGLGGSNPGKWRHLMDNHLGSSAFLINCQCAVFEPYVGHANYCAIMLPWSLAFYLAAVESLCNVANASLDTCHAIWDRAHALFKAGWFFCWLQRAAKVQFLFIRNFSPHPHPK